MTEQSSAENPRLPEVTASAYEEIDYTESEGKFFDFRMPASVPCQLRFVHGPQQDTQRFHDALDIQGFAPLDDDPAQEYDGGAPHYDGEVMYQEDYHRLKVVVFRQNAVRIYPYDHKPSKEELELLIHTIAVGWKSQLYHDPIEDND